MSQEPTGRGKKLLALNLGAHGHVNPTLPVVAELVRRGVDVLYFATPPFQRAVEATGARFQPYDSLFIRESATAAKQMQTGDKAEMMARFPLRLLAEAEHVVPEILAAARGESFDGLIYDNMCLAGRLTAQVTKLPAMQFRPSYVVNEHFSLLRAGAMASGPEHPAVREFREKASALSRKYGVEPLEPWSVMRHAEPLNVVFMPRAFQPFGETFDERFLFVGPSIAPRPTAGAWTPPAGDAPLLFFSLGTVFNDAPEIFAAAFRALGETPWQVLAAVGEKIDVAALGPVPSNFTLATHVPQLEVLQHARLFITHGGMNSTQESLWFGVPMIVIPQMLEQAMTAKRVTELGLGRAFVEPAEITPEALGAAVREVDTTPSYRESVAAMQREVRGAGGYVAAADAIARRLGMS